MRQRREIWKPSPDREEKMARSEFMQKSYQGPEHLSEESQGEKAGVSERRASEQASKWPKVLQVWVSMSRMLHL